ncbi:pentapeptide repeat-containing protein [Streptomyces sp. YJ-C3]
MSPAALSWPSGLPLTTWVWIIEGLVALLLAWVAIRFRRPQGRRRENPLRNRAVRASLLIAVGAVAFVVVFWRGPWWFDSAHIRSRALQPADGVVITGFRTGLVALAAGIIAGAGLYYTHRSHLHTVSKDREQADLTREGQVTGRYVEAIKLLASDKIHERLGGIYSLERIMRDSGKDSATVVEVLAAYVRTSLDKHVEARSVIDPDSAAAGPVTVLKPLKEPVRAALNVLGRNTAQRNRRPDLRSIKTGGRDLSEADLRGAWMTKAQLTGAHLRGAKLQEAILEDAVLAGAQLEKADLTRANLKGAWMQDAHMPKAVLRYAKLTEATLNKAKLPYADLTGADLTGAELKGANLFHADLTTVRLIRADLKHATLTMADLEKTDLTETEGLTAEQIHQAKVYTSTNLPPDIAGDPQVRARIAQCEAARAAGEEPPTGGR